MHVLTESVVIGGMALFFYKKISELELSIEDLKAHVSRLQTNMDVPKTHPPQNGIHRIVPKAQCENGVCILKPTLSRTGTGSSLRDERRPIPKGSGTGSSLRDERRPIPLGSGTLRAPQSGQRDMSPSRTEGTSGLGLGKVSISKVSNQVEFDNENPDFHTKVPTFSKKSPNPVLQSVTPTILDKILDEIDNE